MSSPPSVSVPATPGTPPTSLLDLARGRIGTLHRRAVRKADGNEDGALVLIREEAVGHRWKMAAAANQKQNRPISANAGFRISVPTPAR